MKQSAISCSVWWPQRWMRTASPQGRTAWQPECCFRQRVCGTKLTGAEVLCTWMAQCQRLRPTGGLPVGWAACWCAPAGAALLTFHWAQLQQTAAGWPMRQLQVSARCLPVPYPGCRTQPYPPDERQFLDAVQVMMVSRVVCELSRAECPILGAHGWMSRASAAPRAIPLPPSNPTMFPCHRRGSSARTWATTAAPVPPRCTCTSTTQPRSRRAAAPVPLDAAIEAGNTAGLLVCHGSCWPTCALQCQVGSRQELA